MIVMSTYVIIMKMLDPVCRQFFLRIRINMFISSYMYDIPIMSLLEVCSNQNFRACTDTNLFFKTRIDQWFQHKNMVHIYIQNTVN